MKKIKLITGLTLALMFGGVAVSPVLAQSDNSGGGGASDGPSPTSSPSNTSPSPSDAGSRDGFQRDMSPQDTQRQNSENPTGVEGQRFDPVRDRDRDGNLVEQENRTNEVDQNLDQRLMRQQNEGQIQQNMNQPATGVTAPDQTLDQRLMRQQNEGQFQQNMNQPQQQFPSTGNYEDTQSAPVRGLW